MDEVWKPCVTFPEILASNLGRILLPASTAKMPHGGIRTYTPKPSFGNPTKSSKTARHVYMGKYAYKFGNLKVHRLVCEAFHGPRPSPKHVVIHLNEDATDNRAENLKWGTQKENLNMPGFIEYCKGRTGENSPTVKWRKKRMQQE